MSSWSPSQAQEAAARGYGAQNVVAIDEDALVAFSESVCADPAYTSVVTRVRFPLTFSSSLEEANLICLMALLNFGGSFAPQLRASTGNTLEECIKFGAIGFHIGRQTLNTAFMSAATAGAMAEGFNIPMRQSVASPIAGVEIEVPGPLAGFASDLASQLRETAAVLSGVGCPDMARLVMDAAGAAATAGQANAETATVSVMSNGSSGSVAAAAAAEAEAASSGAAVNGGGADAAAAALEADEAGGASAGSFVEALARALPALRDVESVRAADSEDEIAVPIHKNAQILAAELHHRVGLPGLQQLCFRGVQRLAAVADADTVTGLVAAGVLRPTAGSISAGGSTAAASPAASAIEPWDPTNVSFGPELTAPLRVAAVHACNQAAERLGPDWSALDLSLYTAHLGRVAAEEGRVRQFVPCRSKHY